MFTNQHAAGTLPQMSQVTRPASDETRQSFAADIDRLIGFPLMPRVSRLRDSGRHGE
jgi:hypothetical protein